MYRDNCELIFPIGSLESYQQSEGWSRLTNYSRMGGPISPMTSLTFTQDKYFLPKGTTMGKPSYKYEPRDAYIGEWNWDIVDPTAVIFDSGSLVGMQVGESVVTLNHRDLTAECTIVVYDPEADKALMDFTITSDTTASIKSVNGVFGKDLFLPETVDIDGQTYTVTGVMADAFTYEYMANVKRLHIPPTLKTVKADAFLGATSLDGVYIEDLNAWLDIDFYVRDTREDLDISNPVYNNDLYLNGVLLEHIDIPDSVTKLKQGIFAGCKSLKSISGGKNLEEIGSAAFAWCNSLESIDLSQSSVRTVDSSAFYGCNASTLILPECLEKVGRDAFYRVGYLEELYVPASVTYIGNDAFYGTGIKTLRYAPVGLTSIGSADYQPFYGCRYSKIILEEGVEQVPSYLIDNSNSQEFTIEVGSTVKLFNYYAIYMALGLQSITFNGVTPPSCVTGAVTPLASGASLSFDVNVVPLKVPRQSQWLYKNAKTWKVFANIVGYSTGEDNEDVVAITPEIAKSVSQLKATFSRPIFSVDLDIRIPVFKNEDIVSNMLNEESTDEAQYYLTLSVDEEDPMTAIFNVVNTDDEATEINTDGVYYFSVPNGVIFVGDNGDDANTQFTVGMTVDQSSGIESNLIDGKDGEDAIYDLQGRRLPKATPGFRIVNGQKQLIK